MLEIIRCLESCLKKEEFELFFLKLWCIWKDRCAWTHKPNFHPGSTVQLQWGNWADNFLKEYRSAQHKICNTSHSLIDRYSKPRANLPEQGFTIYVDAAFNDETLSYATGYAIFYPGGVLVAVGCRRISPMG